MSGGVTGGVTWRGDWRGSGCAGGEGVSSGAGGEGVRGGAGGAGGAGGVVAVLLTVLLAVVLFGLQRRSELVISVLVRLFDFVDDFVCQFIG